MHQPAILNYLYQNLSYTRKWWNNFWCDYGIEGFY